MTVPGLLSLAERINAEHAACERSARDAMQHALEAGRLLVEAKAAVPHGSWLGWVREHCTFSPRSAQVYMRLAANAQRVAHLPVREALRELAEPKPKEIHPACQVFPPMAPQDFELLKQSIKEHGLLRPIWIDGEGRILDGKERYRACRELGIEPRFETYSGDAPVEFAISMNIRRSHLTRDQVACIAVNIDRFGADEGTQGSGPLVLDRAREDVARLEREFAEIDAIEEPGQRLAALSKVATEALRIGNLAAEEKIRSEREAGRIMRELGVRSLAELEKLEELIARREGELA